MNVVSTIDSLLEYPGQALFHRLVGLRQTLRLTHRLKPVLCLLCCYHYVTPNTVLLPITNC